MRSAQTVEPEAPGTNSDLTAKSRIRDAALLLFGRDGFAATSVRAVAQRAGVSPALVIHHYGSKERLREACDDYIVNELIGGGREELERDLLGTIRTWLAETERFRPVFTYLARMLATDDSGAGANLFDALLVQTERMIEEEVAQARIRPTDDVRALAALLTTHSLALLVFESHVGRALDRPHLDEAAMARILIPSLEIYTHGLYSDSAYLDAVKSLHRSAP